MLRFPTQFTKMHRLLVMMMMMWAFMVMTTAQSHCDTLTQYTMDGKCCQLCPPGTSMTSLGTCHEPQCKECGENEYQDAHTNDSKCKRQDYCDPNRNFKVVNNKKKTEKFRCMCKLGFHCSDDVCLICVMHRTCKPGEEAQLKGNEMHDTVCQKCPEGTFSTNSSWDSVCGKWTECGSGYHIQQSGTAISDNICVKNSRQHLAVIAAVVPLFLVALAVGVVVWLCRGPAKGKVKGCVESCMGGEREPRREETLIANPTTDPLCEPKEPELHFSQEDSTMTPEENEDEPSQETFKTDKGNYVMQENGKADVLSRQESQTQTLS